VGRDSPAPLFLNSVFFSALSLGMEADMRTAIVFVALVALAIAGCVGPVNPQLIHLVEEKGHQP
jgi:hypothetical protein